MLRGLTDRCLRHKERALAVRRGAARGFQQARYNARVMLAGDDTAGVAKGGDEPGRDLTNERNKQKAETVSYYYSNSK